MERLLSLSVTVGAAKIDVQSIGIESKILPTVYLRNRPKVCSSTSAEIVSRTPTNSSDESLVSVHS